REAGQGALLRDGMSVVIAGRPNAGKSSLLNSLAGYEAAIVTDIEGTTRDILREHIHIDGMPLHVTDTAGLRNTADQVEEIGVERALKAIGEGDRRLRVGGANSAGASGRFAFWAEFLGSAPRREKVTLARSQGGLPAEAVEMRSTGDGNVRINLCGRRG